MNFIFSGKQRPVSSSLPPFPGLCPAGIPGLSLPLGAAKASLPTHGAVTGWVTPSAGHPFPARPPAMTPEQGHVQFCQILEHLSQNYMPQSGRDHPARSWNQHSTPNTPCFGVICTLGFCSCSGLLSCCLHAAVKRCPSVWLLWWPRSLACVS